MFNNRDEFLHKRKMFFNLSGLRWQAGTPGTSGAPTTPPPTIPPTTPPPATPPPDADPARTFKQSELDHMFAERARQGGESAVKKLLADLGIEKPDDLKAFIQKAKDAENAQKTESQKLADEVVALKKSVESANTEKQTALATATDRLMKAAVLAEAMKQFDDTELNSVWMAIKADAKLAEKIKAKEDGENFDGIADVLKEIAKAHPRWLKSTSGAIGTPRQGGKALPAAGQPGGEPKKNIMGIRL